MGNGAFSSSPPLEPDTLLVEYIIDGQSINKQSKALSDFPAFSGAGIRKGSLLSGIEGLRVPVC